MSLPYKVAYKAEDGTHKIIDSSEGYGKNKVFISYRKDDRFYVQSVCDEILDVEIDEELAVWYDDNLEYGKDYEKQLQEALKDAQIFVMVITPRSMMPNAKGEDNYMHSVEYKYASEHMLPILPIQCEDVDMEKYNEMYGNMHMVSWRSDNYKEELAKYMSDTIIRKTEEQEIEGALKETEATMRNIYLIGKAYIKGIKVERNVKRGVRNITFAAEEGLLEAAKELSRMYNTGDGVKIDYNEAIKWQKKAVELSRAKFDQDPTYPNLKDCFWEQIYLGDYYNDMAKLTEAENAYTSAGELAQAYYEQDKSNDVLRMISAAYDRAGSVCERRANLAEAEQFYQKCIVLFEQLVKESPTVQACNDLSISYNKLAGIKEKQGKLGKAEQLYQQSLDIREQLVKAIPDSIEARPDSIKARSNLSVGYCRLALIKEKQGNIAEAEQLYKKYSDISEQLVKESPTIQARRDLAVSYEMLARIKEMQNKLDEAEQLYQKDLELSEQLVKESPTIEARRDLSVSYEKLAGIKEAQKDLAGAEQLYQQSLDICEQLVKESPDSVEARRGLLVSYNNLAGIKKAQDKLDEAEHLYQKCIVLSEQLVKESPDSVEARRDLSVSYNNLAMIREKQGDIVEAEQLYQKGLEIAEQLAKESPNSIEVLDQLACSYGLLGILKMNIDYVQKGWSILKKLSGTTGLDSYKQRCDSAMIAILQMQSKLAEEEDSAPEAPPADTGDSAPAPRKSLFGRLFGRKK